MNDQTLSWDVPLQEYDLTPVMPTLNERHCSRIGNDMTFEGAFFTANGCDVQGTVVGHINALPSSIAAVRTHPNSSVHGEVRAPYVSINGEFDGLIDNPVGVTIVGQSAHVKGVIRYKVLRSDGALLDANLIKTLSAPGGAA